jgi:sugar lactone lactonase YvrE
MPTWDEVETVDERELTVPSLGEASREAAAARSEAVGRIASVWRLADPKELLEGEALGTAILSRGGLTLAPRPEDLVEAEERCLWPVAVAADGSVYVGSWTDGAVRRTTPHGEAPVVLETSHAGVQALASAPGGAIYAAGVPGGTIYRLVPGEEPAEVCHLGVQNVWALAVSDAGDLWAATGPEGKLYRISPDGNSSVAFTAADRHITCLAAGADGTLYLGSSPKGKVYALPPDGPPEAVCEVDAAVQSLAVGADGDLYIGTSPKARVLKVARDGSLREILKVRTKHIFALLAGPDGIVYAAPGPPAKVIAIYPDETSALLYDAKTACIAALAGDGAGNVYLTAADSGRLLRLNGIAHRVGTYHSVAHDAGATARWGTVRWRGDVPEGAALSIFTRTGHTAHPDETWNEWAQVPSRPGAQVASPPGRYLQCRLDLSGQGAAVPTVDAVEFVYLPANQAPEVQLTAPKGDEIWSGRQTIRWSGRDRDGDELEYEVYWSSDRGATWSEIESETQPAEEGEEAPEVEGEAEPEPETGLPGEDETTSQTDSSAETAAGGGAEALVGVRRMGEYEDVPDEEEPLGPLRDELPDEEVELEEELAEAEEEAVAARPTGPPSRATSLKWDTAKVPDGIYWLKVVASDEKANPADPREGEAVSRPLLVDNTPPELILDLRRKDDDPPPDSVTVFDRSSYVTSAEFRVGDGEWLAAVAEDGIFDGQFEAVVLDVKHLPEGSHEVGVRARDAAGNVASKTLRYQR